MDWDTIKSYLKSFWNFIWHEDSVWSWIVNIFLAFIIIKFLLYPGIGLALGTNLPVVEVISESMEHNGGFEQWWSSPALCGDEILPKGCTQGEWYISHGISKEQFQNFTMRNGFNKGDIMLLKGVTYDKLKIGDVLVYQSKLAYPIIHRVVEKNDFMATKGDHNQRQITDSTLNEKYVTKDQIIGIAWFKIPYLGYVKILFVELVQCITFNGCTFG